MTAQDLERNPDFWWLRLRYAQRDGDDAAVAEAQERLRELGVFIRFENGRQPRSEATR